MSGSNDGLDSRHLPFPGSHLNWLTWRLLAVTIPSTALILGTGLYLASMAEQTPVIIASVEAELIAFTLVVLALLSIYSARSFGADAESIVGTQRMEMGQMRQSFHQETERLLDRNAAHWREQSTLLAGAASALEKVVELQTGALDLTKAGIQLNQELLALEQERERLRQSEEEIKRLRLQPLLGLVLSVPQAAIIKHMRVSIHNRGMDGRNLVVFFGVESVKVLQWQSKGIDPQSVLPIDFGDIADWPSSAQLSLICEVSDVLGNRYRFVSRVQYERHHTGVVSVPTVDPGDWVYPDPTRL